MPIDLSRDVRTSEDADAALVRRAGEGDAKAVAELFRRHSGSLRRYLGALSGHRSGVDDAVQETFLAVVRHASGYRGGDVRAWLFVIARRALLRGIAADANEELRSTDELGVLAGWGDDRKESRIEESLVDRDRLAVAFRSLPPQAREVLLLVEGEGFSLLEVAALTNQTLAAVKSRLHRARLSVLAALAAEAS